MRTIFVIGVLLLIAFLAGWFTVDRDQEGTTIRINRDEIRQDARQAIDRGREFLDREGHPISDPHIARQPDGDNVQGTYIPPANEFYAQPPLDPQQY